MFILSRGVMRKHSVMILSAENEERVLTCCTSVTAAQILEIDNRATT